MSNTGHYTNLVNHGSNVISCDITKFFIPYESIEAHNSQKYLGVETDDSGGIV